MLYTSLVFNLLPNQFWSITAALPRGAAGTRLPVGIAEIIPEVTFVARELVAADGFDAALRNTMNGFIQQGRQFHARYGLNPISINCFDDVLVHFQAAAALIDRIRIVSHGNDAFLFLPLFRDGKWDFGMDQPWLQALQSSDAGGLRFLIRGDPHQSPLLLDSVDRLVDGVRTVNAAVLAPFGLDGGGHPPASPDPVREYFDVVHDLFQLPNGTLLVGTVLLTAAQRTTLTASLNLVEASARARAIGVTPPGGVALTAAHLDALKNAVLAATPAQLGFMGAQRNLAATVVADVNAALAAAPRVEADIRVAIGGANSEPALTQLDYLDSLMLGLQIFAPAVLTFLGPDPRNAVQVDPDLLSFGRVAIDLHHLKNVGVLVAGAPSTAAQRTAVRNGLLALATIVSARIRARPGNVITAAQLNAFRDAIENRPVRESAVTGGTRTLDVSFPELTAANTAMPAGFRARLDHFRGLMKPGNQTTIDIRGCLVGATPAFLDVVRDFLGGAANKPTITAPDWFQSFPIRGFLYNLGTSIFANIDDLIANGTPPDIVGADVAANLNTWRNLIDFDPHVDFIGALFAGSQRDFAALGWRAWRTAANPGGVPVLRMEAGRVDDLDTLNLGALIERFQAIFEIAAANAPNTAARVRLTQLQPHVAAFKVTAAAIAAAVPGPPTQAQLNQFLADLSALAAAITGIPGFPPPAVPLNPPAAPPSLADIQGFSTRIQNHLDAILQADLNAFFAAVQGALGNPNARARYFFNVGLPLLIQSGVHPSHARVSTLISAGTAAAATTLIAGAYRSWMRIQWSGTPAQANAMNATITTLAIGTDTQRGEAAQESRLTEQLDLVANPGSAAAISPMPAFHGHIVTRP